LTLPTLIRLGIGGLGFPDSLLEKMIEMPTLDELAMLLGSTPQQQQQVVREPRDIAEAILAVDQYVSGLEAVLDRYPQLSNIVCVTLKQGLYLAMLWF